MPKQWLYECDIPGLIRLTAAHTTHLLRGLCSIAVNVELLACVTASAHLVAIIAAKLFLERKQKV